MINTDTMKLDGVPEMPGVIKEKLPKSNELVTIILGFNDKSVIVTEQEAREADYIVQLFNATNSSITCKDITTDESDRFELFSVFSSGKTQKTDLESAAKLVQRETFAFRRKLVLKNTYLVKWISLDLKKLTKAFLALDTEDLESLVLGKRTEHYFPKTFLIKDKNSNPQTSTPASSKVKKGIQIFELIKTEDMNIKNKDMELESINFMISTLFKGLNLMLDDIEELQKEDIYTPVFLVKNAVAINLINEVNAINSHITDKSDGLESDEIKKMIMGKTSSTYERLQKRHDEAKEIYFRHMTKKTFPA